MVKALRWLVKVKGERGGELFKMHSATKWYWLLSSPHVGAPPYSARHSLPHNVDPQAWLTTFERIAAGWPNSDIDALLPWKNEQS
jgi:hypothetical protein